MSSAADPQAGGGAPAIYVLESEAEIEVFEAWFGDLFDELFSTRH
jgi:hypothetical protein